MTFANPAGLWLLALAIPIVVLHILRPRRDEVEVPSVYLWREVAVSVSGARPWQRLRLSLLLVAQLLAVIGLALAVARPVRLTESPVAEHTVFIVDASGSMAAHDGDPDRLADAVEEAKQLRREIPAGGVASVVVADTRPRVVLTQSSDRGAFDSAVEAIETTPGAADFAGAFVLAEGQETGEGDIAFVLVSDGGLSDEEQRLLPPGTTYRAVGEDSTNRAITRLTVEPQSRGGGLFAVVGLSNTGGEKAEQTLRLDVDGRTVIDETVELGTGEDKELTYDLPAGERVEAFLEGEDLLDADDHFYAAAPPQRALDVFVAGPLEDSLATLLEALEELGRVEAVWPEAMADPDREAHWPDADFSGPADAATTADLVIYNQVPVPAAPTAPFWAIAPPDGLPGVSVTGSAATPALVLVRNDDPLLVGLDLSAVLFAETQTVDAPTGEVLVGAEQTALVLRGRLGETPYIYTAFALTEQSTLPIADAFPILADRILVEMAGAALPPGALTVGQPLPVDAAKPAHITGPGGTEIDLAAGQPAPHADRVGFWSVTPEGDAERALAVNPAARESELAPADSLLTPERTSRPGDKPPRGQVSILSWVALPLLAILILEWLLARRRSGVSRRQFRVATALRVLVALALIGALLDLAWIRHTDRVATMFVVDASDSLGASGQDAALDWVRDAIETMPGDARAGVALFGGDARLELTMQSDPVLGPASVQIDRGRTDLAQALRLAGSVLPSDAQRRVVLVSDGRPTEGDVLDETDRLVEAGIPVDVHVIEGTSGADAAVTNVDVPNTARQGEQVPIAVTVHATSAGPALVSLLADGTVLEERSVELVAGDNVIDPPFLVAADRVGVARFQARVSTATDTVRQNDVGYGAVDVKGPPSVLVVEGRAGAGTGLTAALRAGGMTVDVSPAGALPSYEILQAYDSVVLVDVPAEALTSEQVTDLTNATRSLGRGVVTIGGTQSYGLGGYLNSDLEEILPVVSDILDPRRRQTVSQVLAVDTSGSMGACHCAEGGNMESRIGGGVRKTDIARAGAARAIEALTENDEVGILAVDTEDEWVLDLQSLPTESVVTSGLRKLNPTGETTDLSTALTTAAASLRESRTSLKHIILFTDGFVNEAGIFDDLADQAAALREEGITVSVLATGEGAAAELEAIATAGGGRFYPGRDLQEIPQLMQEEATIASRDFVNEGEFLPVRASQSTLVPAETPPLLGYIATTAKQQTETHLRIGPDEDPLLVSWNVGLGRVTSWTSDGGERWAQTWTGWEGYVDFWSGVVADTFPREVEEGEEAVTARVVDGILQVRAERADDRPFADGSEARAQVVGPDRKTYDVRLERVGGSVFAGELPVTAAGTYAVRAEVQGPAETGTAAAGNALANLSYSPEYEPGEADPSVLLRVSEATRGRGEITADQSFDPEGLRSGRSRVSLAKWLLLAAALLWPVAVALSRLALRGSVTGQVRHVGATAAWWVRSRVRVPTRPGRQSGPEGPRPPPRPERPVRPTRPDEKRPEKETAPAATLGSLLSSQRQRRGEPPPPPE